MSLITDFKDRIPTQVLTNGAIRYEQFDSSGNSLGYVYFKRADEPTEVGNAWNKATYDGIKDEINSKLNMSDKATQAQAIEGIDDIRYMTPLTVNQAIKQLCEVKLYEIEYDGSSHSIDSYITANTVLVEIESFVERYYSSSDLTEWRNDSSLYGMSINSSTSSSISSNNINLANNRYNSYFKLMLDVRSKLFYIIQYHGNSSARYTSDNDYTVSWGVYSGSTLGSILARRVEEGRERYLKLKVFDSPKITGEV